LGRSGASVEGRQASIDAEGCVHARIESATCRSCVEVCPRRAWQLDDDGLTLDPARCDGCGLCVAACPTAAIAAPRGEPIRRQVGTRRVLLAACEYALPEAGQGCVTCLHAVSVSDLLRHWRQGERAWLVLTADCAACPRGRGVGFSSRIEWVNELLRARGEPTIQVKAISAALWLGLRQGRDKSLHDRRGFLRRLLQRPVGTMSGQSQAEDSTTDRQPPGLYLTGRGPLPWTIRLDPQACVACHACIRVCPTAALRMEGDTTAGTNPHGLCAAPEDESAVASHEASLTPNPSPRGGGELRESAYADFNLKARYRLLHERCTGCGICVDVCAFQAIRLLPWSRPEMEDLPLKTFRCKDCGADCKAPVMPGAKADICWVCMRNRTARRLYQVLEG